MYVSKKIKKHHNNKGYKQVKNGSTHKQLEAICKRLGLPFSTVKSFKHVSKRTYSLDG